MVNENDPVKCKDCSTWWRGLTHKCVTSEYAKGWSSYSDWSPYAASDKAKYFKDTAKKRSAVDAARFKRSIIDKVTQDVKDSKIFTDNFEHEYPAKTPDIDSTGLYDRANNVYVCHKCVKYVTAYPAVFIAHVNHCTSKRKSA